MSLEDLIQRHHEFKRDVNHFDVVVVSDVIAEKLREDCKYERETPNDGMSYMMGVPLEEFDNVIEAFTRIRELRESGKMVLVYGF